MFVILPIHRLPMLTCWFGENPVSFLGWTLGKKIYTNLIYGKQIDFRRTLTESCFSRSCCIHQKKKRIGLNGDLCSNFNSLFKSKVNSLKCELRLIFSFIVSTVNLISLEQSEKPATTHTKNYLENGWNWVRTLHLYATLIPFQSRFQRIGNHFGIVFPFRLQLNALESNFKKSSESWRFCFMILIFFLSGFYIFNAVIFFVFCFFGNPLPKMSAVQYTKMHCKSAYPFVEFSFAIYLPILNIMQINGRNVNSIWYFTSFGHVVCSVRHTHIALLFYWWNDNRKICILHVLKCT